MRDLHRKTITQWREKYLDLFHPVVRVKLKLIKTGNYSQTQQFYYYKRRHVSALLLSHHQACALS
jgi:hypothetical protein